MGKGSGGTRNYRTDAKRYATRLSEFQSLISSGIYDKTRSYFDESGGFYVTHINHNPIDDASVDKSDDAVLALAKKGYKVYLDDETSTIDGLKMPDGRVYTMRMDIKTINEAGNNTIRGALQKASKQILQHESFHNIPYGSKKHAVVLYQNTEAMTSDYVKEQIQLFKDKTSGKLVNNINMVIVVGLSGRVHRHPIK